ncbi:iron ABC transporter permease [Rhizobium sp. FY34]|uniref:FecCD family ABC transporter permease n=1 Tax=Rhizobium sp. FY34 TaxID=2562309 RepID=UPI0010C13D35|nr:iron ABC transporter permease [Rhizobium sp. FY34]
MSSHGFVWRAAGFSLRFRPQALLANLWLLLALVLAAVLSLGLGSHAIAPGTVLAWLSLGDIGWTPSVILGQLRAPRLALAMLSGAMLALAGGLTQHVTRNGLADPSLIGVKAGAALCIVALILAFPAAPLGLRPVIGLAGGLAAGLAVGFLARGTSPLTFVMIGFGLSWCLSSVLVVLLTSADIRSLQRVMLWLAGSLEGADWPGVQLASLILIVASAIILSLARHAELDDIGAEKAATLGVRQAWLRSLCLCAVVLLVAGAVSVVGGLGFVGLIAPHLARLLPRQSLRSRLVSAMLIGALLVLSADLAGAMLFLPIRLPVGIPLAMIGAPMLILLLWLRRNRI